MSKKKQLIPAIRFKALTHPWEQRKLGDIADIKDSARISNELWVENGIPYLRSSDLVNGELNGELFISKETYEGYASKTGAPQKDDVLFTSGGKVGVVYHKKDESPVYVQGGAVLYVKTSTSNLLDGSFLSIYFSSPRMQTYMDIASSGGTIKHFTLKPANASPIIFPGLSEQQKIGAFFKELDKTIALHQRQLDNYKALKKVILQKIFNQELRFKDENGNQYPKWMRKTVNDIGDVVTGTTPSTKEKAYYNNGIYPWVTPTDIVQKNIDSTPRKLTEQGLSKGRMLPENTILVTCIASIGKNAILKQKGSCNQQINAIVCNKNHNYEFVYYLMEKNTDVLKSLAGKGTMDIVNKDVFSKMQVTVPCLEEQLRIGKFLSELDGKSEDEHKIVNLMKKEKQGLMQQMFV